MCVCVITRMSVREGETERDRKRGRENERYRKQGRFPLPPRGVRLLTVCVALVSLSLSFHHVMLAGGLEPTAWHCTSYVRPALSGCLLLSTCTSSGLTANAQRNEMNFRSDRRTTGTPFRPPIDVVPVVRLGLSRTVPDGTGRGRTDVDTARATGSGPEAIFRPPPTGQGRENTESTRSYSIFVAVSSRVTTLETCSFGCSKSHM